MTLLFFSEFNCFVVLVNVFIVVAAFKTSWRCWFLVITIAQSASVGKVTRIQFWIKCFQSSSIVAKAFDVTALVIRNSHSSGSIGTFESTCLNFSNASAVT